MISRIVTCAAACAVLGAAGGAQAQTTPTPASAIPVTAAGIPIVGPMLGPPRVTWLFSQGDANGTAGDSHVPQFVLDPIRLGLLGDAVPQGQGDLGCRDANEATGSATASNGGFAMQHAAAFQLVPRLTLAGFARGGCAFDTGIGASVVYATPIRKDIWFAASAGILNLPHAGPGGTTVIRTQLRADVIFARPQGRSYAVGVSTKGLTFGGVL